MIADERHGVWSRAMRLLLPADAARIASNQTAQLNSVTCTGVGFCETVGYYTDRDGAEQPMVASETHGVWGRAIELLLPARTERKASFEVAGLSSVSCPRIGSCEAVGYFTNPDQRQRPMIAREDRRVWRRPTALALPADADVRADGPGTGLNSIVCSRVDRCEVVGQYPVAGSFSGQPMAASETANGWGRATRLSLPPMAVRSAPKQYAGLFSLSCPRAGMCEAVGSYTAATGAEQAMVVREINHAWNRPSALALPPDADVTRHYRFAPALDSIACVAIESCEAAGSYLDANGMDAMTAGTHP
jgi:hypothetical protein